MPYDAKPTVDDVILNVWEERDNLSVNLYLREGADGQGAEVFSFTDDGARSLFEDGYLKAGRTGRGDADPVLLESAFEYARQRGLGALAGYAEGVSKLVERAEALLPEAFAKLDADKETYPEDDEERGEEIAADAIQAVLKEMKGDLANLSEARFADVEEHLEGCMEELLPTLAGSAAPTP
jgi:hypothetical protein